MSLNLINVGHAFKALADLFYDAAKQASEAQPEPAPKRGRGRPVKGEETASAPTAQAPASSTTTPTPAVVERDDPFDTPAPAAPTATLDEVRAALTALKAATSQDIALGVLKSVGEAGNLSELSPNKYALVVAAAKLKAAEYQKAPEPDPFEVPAAAAPAAKVTLEDVKAAVVKAQKRTSTDAVQKVVMGYGGKATNPETGAAGPSLKALPESQFAACIAAIEKLPSTK